jgi:hypothetical protein
MLAGGKLDETTTATIFAENTTVANESLVQAESTSKAGTVKVKKKGKPKLTPKEKKERSVRWFSLQTRRCTKLLGA